MLSDTDSKTKSSIGSRGIALSVILLFASVSACPAKTQAEICGALEDVGLAVLHAKKLGIQEVDVRRQVDVAEDNPIYHMISRIYSSDRVTAEYVLADARMQCAIMFIATPDDGSRPSTGSGIDPTLSTIDWIDACTRDKWISDWKKARGEGTMAKDWDEHPNQGKELAAFLLDKRDLIGRLDYRAKDLDHDPLAKVTPFKSDIANAGMACVIALPKDKIPR